MLSDQELQNKIDELQNKRDELQGFCYLPWTSLSGLFIVINGKFIPSSDYKRA